MMKINLCKIIKPSVGLTAILVLSTVAIYTPTQGEIVKNRLHINGLRLNSLRLNGLRLNGLRFNNLRPPIQTQDTVSPPEISIKESQSKNVAIQLEGSELILHINAAE